MARTRTENVEWLTEDEQRAWRSLMQLIVELQAELETALVDAHNLTEGEYGVLVHLSESPDQRLRMCDLASVLQLSPSGLTRRIDGLARQGLVTREPSSCDRRAMLAVLTDEGMKKLEAAAPTHVASVRRGLIDHLDATQLHTLAETMEALQASRHQT